MNAVVLPLLLKFGAEKARMISMALFLVVFGGFALLTAAGLPSPLAGVGTAFACILVFALLRGVLRYAEQASNHYIAFKLLALIRDKVFGALRRLTPAKLEGRDRGDLISLITADIEQLEVFYAHTISPICIACICVIGMTGFVGSWHILPALVLAGGGAKGSYQIGVWRALQELDWTPDIITGASVGTLNGCLFNDELDFDRDCWQTPAGITATSWANTAPRSRRR